MSDNEQRTQPGFPGFGFIQCHQMDCRNRAAYRYVWPGSGRWAAICEIDKVMDPSTFDWERTYWYEGRACKVIELDAAPSRDMPLMCTIIFLDRGPPWRYFRHGVVEVMPAPYEQCRLPVAKLEDCPSSS